MAVDNGTIYSEVRIQLDKLRGDIASVKSSFDNFAKDNKSKGEQVQQNWEKSFKGISLAGVAAAGALTLAFKNMVSQFAKTEQALANVRAVTGATAEEFELLKNAADEAGQTTRFRASEAADALFFLASAGLSATESVEALEGVLLLAQATGADLSQSAQTITATLSQFNLTAEESIDVVNTFAAANSNSQATLGRLQGALRQVGPVAGGLNKSLEETVGVLQLLFNAGFEGETAGRALKSALADLGNESSVAIKKLTELGVAFEDVNPATNDLADVFGTLEEAGIDTAQALDIFGKVAGPSVIQLLSAGREEIEAYTEAVTDTDEAARQAAIQNDTLAGSIDLFKSALEGAGNSIVQEIVPALRGLLDFLAKVLNLFTKLPGEVKAFIGGAAAIGGALTLLTKIAGLFGKKLSAALGPIGLLVGGLSALGIKIATTKSAIDLEVIAINEKTKALEEANTQVEDAILLQQQYNKLSERELEIEKAKLEQEKKSALADEKEISLLKEKLGALSRVDKLYDGLSLSDEARIKLQDIYNLAAKRDIDLTKTKGKTLNDILKLIIAETELDEARNKSIINTNQSRIDAIQAVLDLTDAERAELEQLGDLGPTLDKYADDRNKFNQKISNDIDQATLTRLELLEKERVETVKIAEQLGADVLAVNELFALKKNELLEKLEEERLAKLKDDAAKELELRKANASLIRDEEKREDELFLISLDERLESLRKAGVEEEAIRKEAVDAVTDYEIAKEQEAADEKKRINKETALAILDESLNLISALNDIYQADADNRIKAVEDRVNSEVITEEEGQKQIAKIKYEADLANWINQGINIISSTALAVVNTLASGIPFPGNVVAAGIVGAAGAAQGVAHAVAAPKPPKLAGGAVVTPSAGGSQVIMAENGAGEVALNAGVEGEALLNDIAGRIASAGGAGGGHFTLQLILNGQKLSEEMAQYYNNGITKLEVL